MSKEPRRASLFSLDASDQEGAITEGPHEKLSALAIANAQPLPRGGSDGRPL